LKCDIHPKNCKKIWFKQFRGRNAPDNLGAFIPNIFIRRFLSHTLVIIHDNLHNFVTGRNLHNIQITKNNKRSFELNFFLRKNENAISNKIRCIHFLAWKSGTSATFFCWLPNYRQSKCRHSYCRHHIFPYPKLTWPNLT
jgi:hypothetical protein